MERRSAKVAAVALTNKMARMAWAMMARGDRIEPLCQHRNLEHADQSARRSWREPQTCNAPMPVGHGPGQPTCARALPARAFDRDPIRGEHYGQRPSSSAASKGWTHASSDQRQCIRLKSPCQHGAAHTWRLADIYRRISLSASSLPSILWSARSQLAKRNGI